MTARLDAGLVERLDAWRGSHSPILSRTEVIGWALQSYLLTERAGLPIVREAGSVVPTDDDGELEIGGVRMTQAQFDAARFPLTPEGLVAAGSPLIGAADGHVHTPEGDCLIEGGSAHQICSECGAQVVVAHRQLVTGHGFPAATPTDELPPDRRAQVEADLAHAHSGSYEGAVAPLLPPETQVIDSGTALPVILDGDRPFDITQLADGTIREPVFGELSDAGVSPHLHKRGERTESTFINGSEIRHWSCVQAGCSSVLS